MKHFLPLLILTGLLFGQDVLTLENGEQFKGKYLGNDAKQVAFKTRTKLMRFNIEEVKEIVSSDGDVVFSVEIFEQKKAKDLAKRQNEIADTIKTGELNYPFETPNEQIGKSGGGFTKFGGLLIGISGFMLMSINNRVLSPFSTLEEIDDFAEKNQSDASLAYTLLAVGGFLIALDKE